MAASNVPAAPPSPASTAARAAPGGPQRTGQGSNAPQPETLVREYRQSGDYVRDAARLQHVGWEVVSVLERPMPPGWLHRASRGRVHWPAVPDVERLVTYVWRGRERRARPALHLPAHSAEKRTRDALRWWLALVVVLVALLALGLLNFFADNLLPGLLALAI